MKRLVLPILLVLLLGGCSAYRTQVARGPGLGGVQRLFVVANANDNRALDRHIVNALRARGLTADSGPRTMMPEDAQVVIIYDDRWTWDFGERLVYLQISARDARSGEPRGIAQFTAKIPGRQTPAAVASDLVTRLFAGDGG